MAGALVAAALLMHQPAWAASVRAALTRDAARSWGTLNSPALTPDGAWFVYSVTRSDHAGRHIEIVARSTRGHIERRFGEVSGSGGAFSISKTGRFVSFSCAGQNAPDQICVGDLADGQMQRVRGMSVSWAVGAEEGRPVDWLVITSSHEAGARFGLTVRNFDGSRSRQVEGVSGYSLGPGNDMIAIAADDRLSIYPVGAIAGSPTAAIQGRFTAMTWSASGHALAAIALSDDLRPNGVLTLRNIGSDTPEVRIIDVRGSGVVPVNFEISDATSRTYPFADRPALIWRRDERGIFFGIRPLHASPAPTSVPNLAIWHIDDARLPDRKAAEASGDRDFSYLSYLDLNSGQARRLADENLAFVRPETQGDILMGFDGRSGEHERSVSAFDRRDMWLVHLASGQRERLVQHLPMPEITGAVGPLPQISPDGRFLVYMDGTTVQSRDLQNDITRPISQGLPAPLFDRGDVARGTTRDYRVALHQGWTSDGNHILLSDGYDLWALALDGGPPINLTGDGRVRNRSYGRVHLDDCDPLRTDYSCSWHLAGDVLDLGHPFYLRFVDRSTQGTGLALWDSANRNVRVLRYEDASITYLKASSSDVIVYARETATTFPDWYVARSDWSPGARLTDVNPQQSRYHWLSQARLLNYVTAGGQHRQAVLYLPPSSGEGHQVPMIVVAYGLAGYTFHRYRPPNAASDGITALDNLPFWAQRGYAILFVDVAPRRGTAAQDAIDDINAGVATAVSTGLIERRHIGFESHSYGGYLAYLLAVRTRLFAAAIAQAGITDWVSLYGQALSGLPDSYLLEVADFSGPWWDAWDEYRQASAVFHAGELQTPLLMVHGTRDNRVPVGQAIGLFNVLRRQARHEVVLLEYRDEGHTLVQPNNIHDLDIRRRQFFDHFLMGEPAPQWWSAGVAFAPGSAPPASSDPTWNDRRWEMTH